MVERENELLEIIKGDKRLMRILQVAQSVNLPNWYIGAGVIRNTVWDTLHEVPQPSPIRDIDFIYYSAEPIDEVPIRKKLQEVFPNVEWDIKNSATVHEWYKAKRNIDRPALFSSEEDIDAWPETASCIGIRITKDNSFLIYAPYGINDLLDMVFRRNKTNEYSVSPEVFKRRVIDKKIAQRWPKATIVYD